MDCCCDCEAPRSLRYVPPAVVFAIIVWLYGSFVQNAQPQLMRFPHRVSVGELVPFHVMTVLLCASLAQCLLSTESFVKRGSKKDGAPRDATGKIVVETKANGERRFCRRCYVWKADRMHHCSSCRRCVLKMDHHCVYINKCIGYFNYKFFLQFLGWSSVTCLYEASLIFRYLVLDHLDRCVALFVHGRLSLMSTSFQIVALFFGSACLGAALLCFFLLHLYLTARNCTTLEFCEKRRDPTYVNYFDVGVIQNLQQVLGSFRELPYWFIPLQSPSVVRRGAVSFPVNSKTEG
ncbi:hypothetical protein PINS_up002070 [Pythium insidiosum]|nr:hypothetical protein PINS_up002070 [Pythium insidiosum]